MLQMLRKNSKGFTLVEVIVVAVIVAVLALVAIQLYQGYVKDSRQNTSENLAASAAGYLQSAYNATDSATVVALAGTGLAAGASWGFRAASGDSIKFGCPSNASIAVSGDSVSATVGDRTSKSYAWK